MKPIISDKQIIADIRSTDEMLKNKMIKFIYAEFKPITFSVCNKFNVNSANVDDIHQESVIAIVKAIMFNKFKEESKLSTYFYQVCKYQIMNKNKHKIYVLEDSESKEISIAQSVESSYITKENSQLLMELVNYVLKKLGNPCETVLRMQMQDYSFKEIAKAMGYNNADTPKNQASRCRKKLRIIINEKPGFSDLLKGLI